MAEYRPVAAFFACAKELGQKSWYVSYSSSGGYREPGERGRFPPAALFFTMGIIETKEVQSKEAGSVWMEI